MRDLVSSTQTFFELNFKQLQKLELRKEVMVNVYAINLMNVFHIQISPRRTSFDSGETQHAIKEKPACF